MASTKAKPLRAASYCRTSGEGQRDNTSIPTQKETNEKFIKQNGWVFDRHYVDECKSGSKIAGRDAFQQMMRGAANNEFDIVVPADLPRYGRDGFDIIESSRTLAREYNVHVVDAKGTFDTRDHKRAVTNFVMAGVAEGDRLGILDRTIKGRIKNAENGLPWTGRRARPVGRDFDTKSKKWYVNDKGRAIANILKRYLNGEDLTSLCREYGIVARSKISFWVWHSQLAGDYYAVFNQPEIGIKDHKVLVPGIPEVVSAKLLARVKKRLRHNRTHNRTDAKQYLLTGFLHCACCKRSMSGKTNIYGDIIYRHHGLTHEYANCDFYSARGDQVEAPILNYLYGIFLDEPAFNEAVERALPPASKRNSMAKQREFAEKQLTRTEREGQRLVKAIAKGADVGLLLSEQENIKDRIKSLQERLRSLDGQLADYPDENEIRSSAEAVRMMLYDEYRQRNWRELSQPEIKRFLLNLFGDDDGSAGIFLRHDEEGKLIAEFKGRLNYFGMADSRTISKTVAIAPESKNQRGKAYTANTWTVPVTR